MGAPTEGLGFLKDWKSVIGYIEREALSINTQKNLYIALKSTLRDLRDPDLKEAEEQYTKKMLEFRDEHNKIAAQQLLSPREEELWVEWQGIASAMEPLRQSVSTHWELQDFIIYCLYVLQPPTRLDYAPMRVVGSSQELTECSGNVLIWDDRPQFCFREYKTSKKYGTVFLDVPPALQEELAEWLELNQSGWLLCNRDGDPMDEAGLVAAIRRVFKKAVGKPLGVNMLRHSYVSYMRRGEPTYLAQQDMAKSMMHSPAMSVLYRKL